MRMGGGRCNMCVPPVHSPASCRTFLPVSELSQGPSPKPCLAICHWFSPYLSRYVTGIIYTPRTASRFRTLACGEGEFTVSSREDLGTVSIWRMACEQSLSSRPSAGREFCRVDLRFQRKCISQLVFEKCTQATMKGDQQCQTQVGSLARRLI